MAAELEFEIYGNRMNQKLRKTDGENEEQTSEILRCLGVKPPHGHRAAAAFTLYSSFKHSSTRTTGAQLVLAAAHLIVASMRKHGRASWHSPPGSSP